MLAGLLPEDELCLLLARAHLADDPRARALELLACPINWDALLWRARQHNVIPLLYRNISNEDTLNVPATVQATLTEAFRANAFRNMFLRGELARVLRLLTEAGIRVIPLKGIALAELLYGDTAFRACSDIDILVPAGDALQARRILLEQGYMSPFTEEFFVHHQFGTSADCPLIPQKEASAYLLEVHWTLLQHSSRDAEAVQDLWRRALPHEFFGVPAYSLTPEWQFLYLASHVATHKWQTLRWIADIHDLCASTSIDWPRVRAMAGQFELEFVAESTLAVCHALYATPLPEIFAQVALPEGIALFPHSLDASETWSAPLFYPKLLKRPTEKLRWLAEMFFVARVSDRRFFRLPASLDFLYYLLRPVRLACKWSWLFLCAGCRRLRRLFLVSAK
jgi:hypothetical protein